MLKCKPNFRPKNVFEVKCNLSMASRKRPITDIVIEIDNPSSLPPKKKPKLSVIKSKLFPNEKDHDQFEELFVAIDECLNLGRDIHKEIAQFATGNVVYCNNSECNEDICYLIGDEERKYKYCPKSNKYYCLQCKNLLEIARNCECRALVIKTNYIQCQMCEIQTHSQCVSQCKNCGLNVCKKCLIFCDGCKAFDCCKRCCYLEGIGTKRVTVCSECYDDTIIQCDDCANEARLYYRGNAYLRYSQIKRQWTFQKCANKDCAKLLCMDCTEEKVECSKCRNVAPCCCEEHRRRRWICNDCDFKSNSKSQHNVH